jgi:hypothetical protein
VKRASALHTILLSASSHAIASSESKCALQSGAFLTWQ